MNSYEFTIVAGGLSIERDDWHDRFYEAGCDDALLTLQRGLFVLHFDRDADTLVEAVESACADIRSAGAHIVRIEPDPLVSASDIAERAQITRQAVSLYVNGDRGEGFPAPVACNSTSRPLWKWHKVAAWLHAAGKLDDVALEAAQVIDRLNFEQLAPVAPVVADAPERVPSEFAQPDYYMRRKISDPRFRSAPSEGRARLRSPFRLRPNQPMAL